MPRKKTTENPKKLYGVRHFSDLESFLLCEELKQLVQKDSKQKKRFMVVRQINS